MAKSKVGLTREDSPYTEQECEEIISKLEALLDGELEGQSQEEIQRMIDNCEYCMEQYNLERSIRNVIRNGFSGIAASKNLLTNIRQRLNLNGSDNR